FWPADRYAPGGPQPSFDKQYVRDWLDASGWNHEPPPPDLPGEVVQNTAARYREAYDRLTGEPFDRYLRRMGVRCSTGSWRWRRPPGCSLPGRRGRSDLARGRLSSRRGRRGPARRVLLRRLPENRRHRAVRPGHGGGAGVRRARWPRRWDLQRLPDPVRGRAASGSAAPHG